MRETNQEATKSVPITVEEYIQFELTAERRHEYINGQLFEMPGEKDINNEIAGLIYAFLLMHAKTKGYKPYMNDVKVAIPGGAKYYYPDVFIPKFRKLTNMIAGMGY